MLGGKSAQWARERCYAIHCQRAGVSAGALTLQGMLLLLRPALRGTLEQVAASAGAACHSSAASISSVLKAMDVPLAYAVGTLRLSTGRHTTEAEVSKAAELIIGECKRQWKEQETRAMPPPPSKKRVRQ